jgi:hypothetical protein
MKGFPKHLNVKQDYLNIMGMFPKSVWGKHFQNLLEDRNRWVNLGLLPEGDEGVIDDTHRISEAKNDKGEVTQRYQLEWKEDQTAKIFRLGFTVEEVQSILGG